MVIYMYEVQFSTIAAWKDGLYDGFQMSNINSLTFSIFFISIIIISGSLPTAV